jgi:hypothetical protein
LIYCNNLPEKRGDKTLKRYSIIILFFLILLPFHAEAIDTNLGREIQQSLRKSRDLIKRAEAAVRAGQPFTAEISQLKTEAENIRIVQLLLQDRFREREEEPKAKSTKAEERQRDMAEGFHKALEEYLSLIDSLPPGGTITQTDLETLSVFLDSILHKKRRPILGILPYTHLNYPSREPNQDPPIKPAYKGGNKTVAPDDLKSTGEAPISREISTLAQTLNWNPV